MPAKAAIATSFSALAALISAGTAVYQAGLATRNAEAPFRVALATAQTESMRDLSGSLARFSGSLHLAYSEIPFQIMESSDLTDSSDEKIRGASKKLNYMLAAENDFGVAINVASTSGLWSDDVNKEIVAVGSLGLTAARCFVLIGQRPDATDPEIWNEVRRNGAPACKGLFTRQPTLAYEQGVRSLLHRMQMEANKYRPRAED